MPSRSVHCSDRGQVMKKIAAVFLLFLATAAVAQVQECNLVSDAKNAQFEAGGYPLDSPDPNG